MYLGSGIQHPLTRDCLIWDASTAKEHTMHESCTVFSDSRVPKRQSQAKQRPASRVFRAPTKPSVEQSTVTLTRPTTICRDVPQVARSLAGCILHRQRCPGHISSLVPVATKTNDLLDGTEAAPINASGSARSDGQPNHTAVPTVRVPARQHGPLLCVQHPPALTTVRRGSGGGRDRGRYVIWRAGRLVITRVICIPV